MCRTRPERHCNGARRGRRRGLRAAERFTSRHELDEPIAAKLETIATQAYDASGVSFMPAALEKMKLRSETGLGDPPIRIAKVRVSLSHDPLLVNAPDSFSVPIRDFRACTGVGWIVASCGHMMTSA